MSRFKDDVAQDIRRVFIHGDEFADVHDIDGTAYEVVVDYEVLDEQPLSHSEGTYQRKFTFFISEDELGYVPVENQMMIFDGSRRLVARVASDMGMLAVTLEANE